MKISNFFENFNILIYIIICQLLLATIVKCKNVDLNCLEIEQGKLCGKTEQSYLGQEYYSFLGIPYASPPLGNLRFKSPEPIKKWNSTLKAIQERPLCPQELLPEYHFIVDEDCLYLNVATPNLSPDSLLPVMFWISGGGWSDGAGAFEMYAPDNFLKENIVYVSVNFRLNVFGYLKIKDPELNVPGNAGFKDIVEALKWVQQNIKHFGGDPNKVTIFGESTGGVTTNLLLISPLSKNLFHRVIYQSGAGTSPFRSDPEFYSKLLSVLNCNLKDKFESFECLNSKSTKELKDAGAQVMVGEKFENYMLAAPVVEEPPNEKSFLPRPIIDLFNSSDIPDVSVMAGYCAEESGDYMEFYKNGLNILPNFTDSDLYYLVPRDLYLLPDSTQTKILGGKFKKFYYGDATPSFDNDDIFIKWLDDQGVFYYVVDSTKRLIQRNLTKPKYFYKFNMHDFEDTHSKYVKHTDDLKFLFNTTPLKNNQTQRNVQKMVKLWANFAKYDNPTPDKNDKLLNVIWEPISNYQWKYLEMNDDDLKMVYNMEREEAIKFWDQVYEEYNKDYRIN